MVPSFQLHREKMAYVTISVIATTFHRTQLHLLRKCALSADLFLYVLHARTLVQRLIRSTYTHVHAHMRARSLLGQRYAKVPKVTSPHVGAGKVFAVCHSLHRVRENNYYPDGRWKLVVRECRNVFIIGVAITKLKKAHVYPQLRCFRKM